MSGDRKHLLLVDDEPQILRALTPAILAEGYAVETATTGGEALDKMAARPAALVILDLGLPDMDGKEVIRRLRDWCDAPIIVLSARDLEAEKVAALDLGADDFVNKPVGIDELLARVRAGLRSRERRLASDPLVRSGDVTIDLANRRVWVQDQVTHLTPREYALLKVLARQPGSVITHSQIIAGVWGQRGGEAQHVRVLVGQLRTKIEAEPSSPRILLTEPGVGYRLHVEDEPPTPPQP